MRDVRYDDLDKIKKLFDNPVALDIETTGLDRHTDTLNMIGTFSEKRGPMWACSPGTRFRVLQEKPEWDSMLVDDFREFLLSLDLENTLIVAHNAKFDIPFIELVTGVKIPYSIDTMLMVNMYDPYKKRLGLEAIVEEMFGEKYGVSLDTKTGVSPEAFNYNMKDCQFTYLIYQSYRKQLSEREMLLAFFMSQVNYVYALSTEHGTMLDVDLHQRAYNKAKRNVEAQEAIVRSMLPKGSSVENLRSPKQLRELLYTELGIEPFEYTDTGVPSTGVKVLTTLAPEYPVLAELLKWRKMDKEISGFLKPYDGHSRIHPQFLLTGTKTGRTSSRKPNLQQIPRPTDEQYTTKDGIRHLLRSPDGYIFVEMDYSQMELRSVAQIADVKAMKHSYINGEDIHMRTGNLVANDGLTEKDRPEEVNKQLRQSAKAVNFGFLYGMSAKTFVDYAFMSYGVTTSLEEAVMIRRNFFLEYTELLEYYRSIEAEVEKYQYIENPLGRRRRVFATYGEKAFDRRSFINTKVQGFASDCLLLALLEISEMDGYNDDFIILGTIHDSILMYVKEDRLDLLPQFQNIMQTPTYVDMLIDKPWSLPLDADVDTWYDRWYGESFDWQEALKPKKKKLVLGGRK